MIVSFVMSLFSTISPFAVRRFVMAVYVNALNRVCGRGLFAHILKEQSEVVPSFTNLYSTSAVVLIRALMRVITAVSNVQPSMVQRVFFREAVRRVICSRGFAAVTSAARTATIDQSGRGNFLDITAVTLDPPSTAAGVTCVTENDQPTETATFQVLEVRMTWFWNKFNRILIEGHLIKANSFNYLARAASCLNHAVRPVSLYSIFSKPPILGAT